MDTPTHRKTNTDKKNKQNSELVFNAQSIAQVISQQKTLVNRNNHNTDKPTSKERESGTVTLLISTYPHHCPPPLGHPASL